MNIFKRAADRLQPIAPKQTEEQKRSVQEMVAEIHETFFTEVDRLLEQANVKNSLHTDKEHLLDKTKRLQALGFGSTKEVVAGSDEQKRLDLLKKENEIKQHIIEAVQYFSQKYPLYKFITEESVKRICNKYGLVYGPVGNYVSTVPDKNLTEIEQFKLDDEDAVYRYSIMSTLSWRRSNEHICSFAEFKGLENNEHERFSGGKVGFQIAAPAKDFNLQGMEIKDFKVMTKPIEVPDPIVLCPVLFKGTQFFLVVSAWGPEASDEDVVNTKYN